MISEKQQRQSRYDGGLEEDGVTPRPLLPVKEAEPLAHAARDRRQLNSNHQEHRNGYNHVELTGCQLCIRPYSVLAHIFWSILPHWRRKAAHTRVLVANAGTSLRDHVSLAAQLHLRRHMPPFMGTRNIRW